jgi:hypothetical protein
MLPRHYSKSGAASTTFAKTPVMTDIEEWITASVHPQTA